MASPNLGAAQVHPVGVGLDDHPLVNRIRMARVDRTHGFAALWVGVLDAWGWSLSLHNDIAVVYSADGTQVTIRAGTPFVTLDSAVLQMADAPYSKGDNLFVPIQLVFELGGWPIDGDPRSTRLLAPPNPARRLVVIDPGHGGSDPGLEGQSGVQEKDVTLGLALALARALSADPSYDVRLTREDDVFVQLADRGAVANALRASSPAVFLSLHANHDPESHSTRGFETYVLGSADSEEALRVADFENSRSLGLDPSLPDAGTPTVVDALRGVNQDHWSSRLAQAVQRELRGVHPGAPRGVGHAPLAVISEATMPAALVEIGFLSNRRDESLISDTEFQNRAAEALARAVDSFFSRYPAANEWDRVGSRD
jgi:N-acetylmuramoyl-L-alanine amidase